MSFESPTVPAFVRNLDLALPVLPQVLITGNVRDIHFLPRTATVTGAQQADVNPAEATLAPYTLLGIIERTCRERGYGAIAVHDIVSGGFRLIPLGDAALTVPPTLYDLRVETLESVSPDERRSPGAAAALFTRLRRALVETVAQRGAPIAVVFPYASRLGSPRWSPSPTPRCRFRVRGNGRSCRSTRSSGSPSGRRSCRWSSSPATGCCASSPSRTPTPTSGRPPPCTPSR
jgi:hypothetical protein